jgi:hypothetical protein
VTSAIGTLNIRAVIHGEQAHLSALELQQHGCKGTITGLLCK